MSVDVEDYFQVSAFDRVVSRATWDKLESRVVANTQRLLDLFDRSGVTATFFVLGWVAERFPALVREIAAAGHEIASHGYDHQLVYTLTPEQFREDVRAAKAAARGRVRRARPRLPGAELLDRRIEPVGARRAHRGRLRVRHEHLPDSPRSLRHSRRRAPRARARAPRGLARGSAGVDGAACAA